MRKIFKSVLLMALALIYFSCASDLSKEKAAIKFAGNMYVNELPRAKDQSEDYEVFRVVKFVNDTTALLFSERIGTKKRDSELKALNDKAIPGSDYIEERVKNDMCSVVKYNTYKDSIFIVEQMDNAVVEHYGKIVDHQLTLKTRLIKHYTNPDARMDSNPVVFTCVN